MWIEMVGLKNQTQNCEEISLNVSPTFLWDYQLTWLHSPNKLLETLLYSLTDRRHQCHSRDDIIFVTALSIAQMSKATPHRGWEVAPCSQAALLGPPPAGADPLVHLIALPRGFWISSLLRRQGHRVPSDHSISSAIWIKKQWKKILLGFEMRWFFCTVDFFHSVLSKTI